MSRRLKSPKMIKQSKSIHLEKWIWDLSSHLEPCRSAFIKDLFLDKIKQDLLKKGLVDEDTIISEEHAELYLSIFEEKQLYQLKKASSFN